ncbi:MAG: hypothetical protein R2751_01125 [Bacteroidales bacterium]
MPATDDFLRRSLLRLSLVLFSGLGLVSCVEPFDPAFDDDGIHPVVEALITDSPGIQTVLLSWSAPLNDTARRGISGAHVALEGDGGTGIEFAEKPPEPTGGVLTELPERTEATSSSASSFPTAGSTCRFPALSACESTHRQPVLGI